MRKIFNLRILLLLGAVILVCILLLLPESYRRCGYNWTIGRFFRHNVQSRLDDFGTEAAGRLKLVQTPEKLVIIALKEEKLLEVWGIDHNEQIFAIRRYPVLAASGGPGPKLREGDRQVPEGFYEIESLHPNSHFYLALKIAYPSKEDITAAQIDGRETSTLGSAIMLHGRGGSTGCIAVDNQAIEEIFFLAASVSEKNVNLLILPFDFRKRAVPDQMKISWLKERYCRLAAAVCKFPVEKMDMLL